MSALQRIALLAVGLIGCWTLLPFPQGGDVHARPLPLLAAQYPFSTQEPPLAGSPLPPRVGTALPLGTPNPLDPPVPAVALRVRVLAQSAPKQEIEYKICVQNMSAAAAHHVLVRNPLPSNARFVRANPEPTRQDLEVQWHLGTLQPGACREIVLVLVPTSDEDVKNCARVQFEHGQCVTTRIGGIAPPPPPPPIGAARLSLTLNGPTQQFANLPAKYQITVRNEGVAPAANVVLSNLIPPQSRLISASHSGQMHMQQVAWQLGGVEAGGTRTVQFVMRAHAAGDLVNQATVLWNRGERVQAEFRTRFVGTAALQLDVTATKDPIAVGGQTSYVITVLNQGTVPATNLRIRVVVPPELKLLRATPDPKDLPAPKESGQELAFAVIKELGVREQARYEVFVEGVRPGDVRLSVEMTADQLKGGPVIQQESTTVVKN